ncbi:hypothetical protein [Methylomonas sp. CM2]|uniref:hypothetical protein n=1 Tax=Methylomonas sp. CM2 TaxID=3417647 RepID=UPI003CE7CD9B
MSNYRRNRVPGGTYFFTVNLLERKSTLLIEHIAEWQEAVRMAREKPPFHIDAWVVYLLRGTYELHPLQPCEA